MKLRLLAMAAAFALSAPASAADFSFLGNLSGPNDVRFFNFTVGSTSAVTLRTFSFAGGTNAAGDLIPSGGFDPILALFDSSGRLINQNDDGGCTNVPRGPSGQCFDTFLQATLAPGDFTVSVMAFSNFAVGPNLSDGFRGTGNFRGRSNFLAFDVLNVGTAVQVGAVPEPATWAMMIGGFGMVGGATRSARRKRKVTVSYA